MWGIHARLSKPPQETPILKTFRLLTTFLASSVEPFGVDHPYTRILDRDNVLLTPHTAWGAIETRTRCLNIVADNIKVWRTGGKQNRVD